MLLFINFSFLIFASPAYSILQEVIQPNGDVICISLHGDEYGSWYEDDKGDIIALNSENYWVYVNVENGAKILTNQIVTRTSVPLSVDKSSIHNFILKERQEKYRIMNDLENNSANEKSSDEIGKKAPLSATGVQKILTVLVQFEDVKFQNQTGIRNLVTNMMNQVDFRHPGQSQITGSLRDFYLKASYEQLDVRATVIGPYTVSHNRAYYGAKTNSENDDKRRALAREVMEMIVDDIDVSQFDNNNDGWVECIHILYAGQGEDLSGVNSDAIWPHKWNLLTYVSGDGVKMSSYIMTPELGMINSYRGIGTVCHELGHILGAPDFYDTENDVFKGTQFFDLMAKGSWNGDVLAMSPAHPNPYVKTKIYGWTTAFELLGNNKLYTIPPSELYNNAIYKLSTSTSGEYYLLENRQNKGLPGKGLVIYHVNSGIEDVLSDNDVNIAHRQNLYVVDANNRIEKSAMGTPESYGDINTSMATFRDTCSKNIYFTSESLPSNSAWNGDTTYNKDVCFISATSGTGIKFVLNPEIEGDDILCDSAIYSLKYVPSKATIEWTYTRPSGILATSVPLRIGSGQGTTAVCFNRGYNLVNEDAGGIIVPENPFLPAPTSARGYVQKPYSGFVEIQAKITFNGETKILRKTIYMPEKVVINNVDLGSLGVWYVGTMQSITLKTPTDDTVLENIRWDVEYPNGSTQITYGRSVVVRPNTKGTLTVTATYLDGCNDEYESHTKTYSIISAFNLTYTNPASGSVEISVTNGDAPGESSMRTMSINNQPTPYLGAYRVELWHDIYGKVREMDVPENNPTITMNLDGLNSGVYVMRLIIDNQIVEASQLIVR